MFSKLSAREKNLLIFLGFLLLIYFLYITLFEGNLAKLEEKQMYLESLERKEEDLSLKIFQYNVLKQNYGNYDLGELLVKYPEEGQIPEIILWLEELFVDRELSKPNISFNKVDGNERYLQISLNFSGPYNNIYNLIEKIENHERLTTIERLNLSGSQNSLSASITFNIYGQSFEDFSNEEYDFSNTKLFGGF
jgi:Tfp pilus assembly protein PilO